MHGAVLGGEIATPPAPLVGARARFSAAGGCAQCERLLRAREGAAAQLAHLTASLELAEGEEASIRALALRIWSAAAAAGVELDSEALGAGVLLERAGLGATRRGGGSGSGGGGGSGAPAVALCEGDGAHPTRAVASAQPHGAGVNVLCVAPLAGGGGGGAPLLLATSGGDKSVLLCAMRDDGECAVLARLALPAPALRLLARPAAGCGGERRGGALLAACLDGGVHLLSWRSADGCVAGELQLRWSAPRAHGKYAAAAAWGASGDAFCSGGGEGSLALFRCGGGGGGGGGGFCAPCDAPGAPAALCAACAPVRLQTLVFPRGAVTALAAAAEGGGAGALRVDTFVVAVAGAHHLAYARLLRLREGAGGGGAEVEAAADAAARAGGERVPLLAGAAPAPAALLLHHAPLSEEAPAVDVAWGAATAAATSSAAAYAAALDGGVGAGGAGAGAAPPHAPFRHTVVDLAVAPGGRGAPLLAAATCGGGVLLLRWGAGGAGATVARACGRVDAGGVRGEPSELAPPARVCWLPAPAGGAFYFAAANGGGEDPSAISIVSAATGAVVAALKGHAGVVKGLAAWVPPGGGAPAQLLSCGFDKSVRVWEQ